MKINSSASFLFNYIIIIIFSIHFFLWSQSFINFDERLLLVLLIPLYFFIENKYKKKINYIFFLILISFILLHLLLNNFFFKKDLLQNFEAVIGSALIALIALMYRSFLIDNLSKIIYFFILTLLSFFLFENLFSKDLYNINNFDCLNGWFSKGKGTAKLFSENSHFGMIAPAIISYMIFVNNKKKVVNYLNLFLISFLFLFLSTTLLMGTILCLSMFLLTKFKILNKFQKITCFCLFVICLIMVLSKPQCNMRVSETIQGVYINYITRNSENLDNKSKTDMKTKHDIKSEWKKTLMNESLNQSSEVTLNSYSVAVNSLKKYPLGIGMNNYFISYNKFSEELSLFTWNVNKEDGSNNFAKMLSEFGVFNFILFYLILNYALRDKEDFYKNSFFYSIILTQLLRGAGYFNGGFLLSLFILLLSISLKKNDDKKISI